MLYAILDFGLLALIEPAIIRGEITSHTTQGNNVLRTALGTFGIELRLVSAILTGINGKVKSKI